MKYNGKNLLPRKFYEGVALNHEASNIKSRVVPFCFGLQRLKSTVSKIVLAAFTLLFVSGVTPVFDIPPVKKSLVLAENTQIQQIDKLSLPNPMHLPHPGYLSTRFSPYHPGLDIATGLGMPIRSIADGVVEEVNYGFLGYGNYVLINHGDGYKSMYAHMGKIYVKKEQTVTFENIIGEVGMTGHTSGPHTHLEITKQGQYLNPLTILPEIPSMPASYQATN